MNLPHRESYYILSIFGFGRESLSSFLPSTFFEFTRTVFSSLLSTLCIYNTRTGYSRPFKVFYIVICSLACS